MATSREQVNYHVAGDLTIKLLETGGKAICLVHPPQQNIDNANRDSKVLWGTAALYRVSTRPLYSNDKSPRFENN